MPWNHANPKDEQHMRSRIVLVDGSEFTLKGAVKYEGAWVWGRPDLEGGLVCWPACRVLVIEQLPDER